MVEDFIKMHHAQSRPGTRDEEERLLNKHFLKTHKETALNRMAVKDILAITDGLKEFPSVQVHAYRALDTFFKWACTRKLIGESPMEGACAAERASGPRPRALRQGVGRYLSRRAEGRLLAGDQHAANHAGPGLWALLDRIGRDRWPRLLRADKGFASDALMSTCEERGVAEPRRPHRAALRASDPA